MWIEQNEYSCTLKNLAWSKSKRKWCKKNHVSFEEDHERKSKKGSEISEKKKSRLNWLNNECDDHRTCGDCENKLLNNSSEKLCKSCAFVNDLNSKRPAKFFDTISDKINTIRVMSYKRDMLEEKSLANDDSDECLELKKLEIQRKKKECENPVLQEGWSEIFYLDNNTVLKDDDLLVNDKLDNTNSCSNNTTENKIINCSESDKEDEVNDRWIETMICSKAVDGNTALKDSSKDGESMLEKDVDLNVVNVMKDKDIFLSNECKKGNSFRNLMIKRQCGSCKNNVPLSKVIAKCIANPNNSFCDLPKEKMCSIDISNGKVVWRLVVKMIVMGEVVRIIEVKMLQKMIAMKKVVRKLEKRRVNRRLEKTIAMKKNRRLEKEKIVWRLIKMIVSKKIVRRLEKGKVVWRLVKMIVSKKVVRWLENQKAFEDWR